ncbi:MAG: YfjI family protein [Legionellaceae bacterium]|nr:YfjI family protein [Legionellaceae bacterium]
MSNFITKINDIKVASSEYAVHQIGGFENITGGSFLTKISCSIGKKDGSHFLRTNLQEEANGRCKDRSNVNTDGLASLLIIDCDKHLESSGQEVDGAPDPLIVSQILRDKGVGHVLYGSYSHYIGDKGHRYRILLVTNRPYKCDELSPTIDTFISFLNEQLDGVLLANAKENSVWSQPWYFPRKPIDTNIEILYLDYLEGGSIPVIEPVFLPEDKVFSVRRKYQTLGGALSAIHLFNEQYRMQDLLLQYGFKRVLVTKDYEKWLSPDSSSGVAGIIVKNNRLYSFHNDQLNDGLYHDAFDLMRVKEGLSERDAIIRASQLTIAPDGRTVDEYNKRFSNKTQASLTSVTLPEARPSVLPLQAEMLPCAIRDYIFDVADRQQSLPDFVAVAAIIGLSGLLGRKVLIYPKQFDDWSVTPNQWGAIIGRPSAMKSPSMKEALKPLRQFENKAKEQFEEDVKNYEEECQLVELEKLEAKNKAKKALKASNRKEAREALKFINSDAPPVRQRLLVNDPSVEKLGELLNENPNGLILVRDELSGWLSKISKEEFQSDRAFYLECFDGNGHYTYDRIGRGTIDIQNCTLSIIGGIQPSKIAMLVRDALRGTSDDGLIQRFQMAIWPDDFGKWEWIDRVPNKQAKAQYDEVFETLRGLQFNAHDGEPLGLRFSSDAQTIFIEWMKEIQLTARESDVHPALESHMLKMPQTIAGLALLFEIIDGGRQEVGVEATSRALDWAEYLLSHARRLYSLATNQSLDGARLILSRREKLPSSFTTRDVQRKCWSGLDNIKTINEALNWLLDYGHIVVGTLDVSDTNGRPKIMYEWASS